MAYLNKSSHYSTREETQTLTPLISAKDQQLQGKEMQVEVPNTPCPMGLMSISHPFAAVFFLSFIFPFFILSFLINNSWSTKGDLHWLLDLLYTSLEVLHFRTQFLKIIYTSE